MSVQHGQVGKFKVLDLLDSAVLEHGQVGRGCNILQWPDLFCNQDLQLEACADWCSWAAFGQ